MALKQNELYKCPKNDCGCEIMVTRSAGPGAGNQNPVYYYGNEMKRESGAPRP